MWGYVEFFSALDAKNVKSKVGLISKNYDNKKFRRLFWSNIVFVALTLISLFAVSGPPFAIGTTLFAMAVGAKCRRRSARQPEI